MSNGTHVFRTVLACFSMLCQIRSIRRSVTRPVLQSLFAALTLTLLDYGCSMMACQQGSWIDSSWCTMLPLDLSTWPREPSTCLRSSMSSAGFGTRSGLSSVTPYSPTTALMMQRRSIRWWATASCRHQLAQSAVFCDDGATTYSMVE